MEGLRRAIEQIGGVTACAQRLGLGQPAVSNWLRRGQVPARWCLSLEAMTEGAVTRHELRPDVFGPKKDAA